MKEFHITILVMCLKPLIINDTIKNIAFGVENENIDLSKLNNVEKCELKELNTKFT